MILYMILYVHTTKEEEEEKEEEHHMLKIYTGTSTVCISLLPSFPRVRNGARLAIG